MSDQKARFIDTANASWYPAVLRRLADDYPEISDKVWSDTITNNAAKLTAERAALVDGPGCTPAIVNEDQEQEHPRGLYSDKCDDCTTGVSCEDAGRCLFGDYEDGLR